MGFCRFERPRARQPIKTREPWFYSSRKIPKLPKSKKLHPRGVLDGFIPKRVKIYGTLSCPSGQADEKKPVVFQR